MKVIDPGHHYHLIALDGSPGGFETLQFVKREGKDYPGNEGSMPGTTTQEVLRALIDRMEYVNDQIPCPENFNVLRKLRESIYQLELRAAKRHGRTLYISDSELSKIEMLPTCVKCNHIGCEGECHQNERAMVSN